MASSTAPIISATGISAPTYAQILAYLTAQYQAIFGADVYIDPDSQDGQLLAVFAQAISDANSAAIAVYNSFSPSTAQGAGLSNNVQINGLSRLVPSFSTAPVMIQGIPTSTITGGQATDENNNVWLLPTPITIPASGTLLTTVTAQSQGAIAAPAGTINEINTPTYGWTNIISTADASVGSPVETDAALRIRQSNSVALPSLTIFEGIVAAIEQVSGVTRVKGYENNTSVNMTLIGGTLPPNNLDFIVENGLALSIAQAIFAKITPGIPTWNAGGVNNIASTLTDAAGSTRLINFQTPTNASISAAITINPLNGWSPTTEALIQTALAAYLNGLPIGANISYFALIPLALLVGTPQYGTFEITAMTIKLNSGAAVTADIQLNYNQAPISNATLITFTVL
jgi:hypothetical protein